MMKERRREEKREERRKGGEKRISLREREKKIKKE